MGTAPFRNGLSEMPNRRAQSKQIIAVAIGSESGRQKVMALNNRRTQILPVEEGLTRDQALIYADGVQCGLRSAAPSTVKLYRQGKLSIDIEQVAGASTNEEAAIFRDGVIAGIDLQSRGYWLADADGDVQPLH
jgi:hypothetical protein